MLFPNNEMFVSNWIIAYYLCKILQLELFKDHLKLLLNCLQPNSFLQPVSFFCCCWKYPQFTHIIQIRLFHTSNFNFCCDAPSQIMMRVSICRHNQSQNESQDEICDNLSCAAVRTKRSKAISHTKGSERLTGRSDLYLVGVITAIG
jgi:hypothetical protein